MARQPRASRLENRTNRLKLPIRINAYDYTQLAPGISLGYCRRKGAGRWQVRVADGKGSYWFKAFALAGRRRARLDLVPGTRAGAGAGPRQGRRARRQAGDPRRGADRLRR